MSIEKSCSFPVDNSSIPTGCGMIGGSFSLFDADPKNNLDAIIQMAWSAPHSLIVLFFVVGVIHPPLFRKVADLIDMVKQMIRESPAAMAILWIVSRLAGVSRFLPLFLGNGGAEEPNLIRLEEGRTRQDEEEEEVEDEEGGRNDGGFWRMIGEGLELAGEVMGVY